MKESTVASLDPERAVGLWTDLRRWPTFIEGFAHTESVDGPWPAPGSKLVWRSIPSGRGRVTELVRDFEPAGAGEARLVTDVYEDALSGRQTAIFRPEGEDETAVELSLDYELASGGPLRGVTDVLFIRRALAGALRRTLRRFATEAAEEASL